MFWSQEAGDWADGLDVVIPLISCLLSTVHSGHSSTLMLTIDAHFPLPGHGTMNIAADHKLM